MEKAGPIRPVVNKALFICSSQYLDKSKVSLPQAKKDVKAVKKFFKEHI